MESASSKSRTDDASGCISSSDYDDTIETDLSTTLQTEEIYTIFRNIIVSPASSQCFSTPNKENARNLPSEEGDVSAIGAGITLQTS